MSEFRYIRLDEHVLNKDIVLGRGDIISKDDIEETPGNYPIYSSSAQGDGKFGEYSKFMFDEELVTWSVDGGGYFFYRKKHKFSVTNVSGFMRVNTDKFSPRFVYYCLVNQHRSLTFDYTIKAHPSVIKTLYWLPDIIEKEQAKIAKILANVDYAIEKTQALIAKYENIKQGMMQDLFTRGVDENGQLRPSCEDAPHLYQETELGRVPKDWKVKALKQLLIEHGGYLQTGPFGSQLHAHEYSLDGVPVVMPQDINRGSIDDSMIARISEARAQMLYRHRLKMGDIVIARRGDLSRAAAAMPANISSVCGTGCFLLRLGNSSLDPHFISNAYMHDMIQRQIEGLAVGSTMPSLNNEIMGKLFFPVMGKDEQERISELIQHAENKLKILKNCEEKYKHTKIGLMQDLLTGKVRVTEDIEEHKEAVA